MYKCTGYWMKSIHFHLCMRCRVQENKLQIWSPYSFGQKGSRRNGTALKVYN